jgi:hypothetical protein
VIPKDVHDVIDYGGKMAESAAGNDDRAGNVLV